MPSGAVSGINIPMKAHTRETQAKITPRIAVEMLKEGNRRFLNRSPIQRNLLSQMKDTAEGQFPFATILSCIDSRVPPELIFDQGIGDIFSIRIAGNVISDDVIGSMEFACRIAGAKLILVMGHTGCGAVKGAADAVKLGHLTGLVEKIQPALQAVTEPAQAHLRGASNSTFVNRAAEQNVLMSVDALRTRSPLLREMEESGDLAVIGAMYDVAAGSVEYCE